MEFSFGIERKKGVARRPYVNRERKKDRIINDLETFNRTDILNEIHCNDNDDGLDFFIDNLIVSVCESSIKNALNDGKNATIPNFGILGYNPFSDALKKGYTTIKCLKGSSNKELLKEYMADVKEEVHQKVHKRISKNNILNKCKSRNKSLYERLYITHGRCYANAKLFTLSIMSIVKFDEELEEHLQKLYKADD